MAATTNPRRAVSSKFGDFVIPIVLAHEWGHAVQARSNFTARTVTKDRQADCFAGAWVKHAQAKGVFKANSAELNTALAGILDCVPDDYIGWDNVDAMPTACRQGDDFPVATLLATQYALAAMTRADDQSDDKTQSLRGGCFAGAYTASVVLGKRADTSSFRSSPGDLDEAITALLVFCGRRRRRRRASGRWVRTDPALPQRRHQRRGVLSEGLTHTGRGIAASLDCPIQCGNAFRASVVPDTAALRSSSARDHDTSPRQIRVSVRRLVATVAATS